MASLAPRPVAELRNAPDDTIGSPDAKTKPPQVMHLEMDDSVLEELLAHARRGKSAQVVFGRNPILRFAGQSHVLSTRPSMFRHEIYKCEPGKSPTARPSIFRNEIYDPSPSRKDWTFSGLVSHSLTLQHANKSIEGMDAALEELKNNMASIHQETEARKTIITPDLPSIRKGRRTVVVKNAQPVSKYLSPNLRPTSVQSTPRVATPTISSESQDRNDAIKFALIHLLAIKPLSVAECAKQLRARNSQVLPVVERIAEKESSGDWRLTKRSYRDLDVWGFPYRSSADREAAIENAVNSYDAQRIDPKDNLWQGLLPNDERFKGKTLSKLKLQQQTAVTPLAKPKVTDKKTAGNAKKAGDAKKAELAKKEAKISNADDPSTKDKASRRNGEAVKTASGTKNGKARAETVRETDAAKKAKAGPAPKTASSKPKTPSPLSSSPPVNASDFEDGHPVHKRLSGSPTPTKQPVEKKAPKRKATEDEKGSEAKKARLDGHGAAPVRKPLPAPRTTSQSVKRKVDDDDSSSLDSAPLKTRRLLANGAAGITRARPDSSKASTPATPATPATPDAAATRKKLAAKGATGSSRGQAPQPRVASGGAHTDSSNSGGTSPEEQLSRRQSVVLASKFRRFYEKYERLYREISAAPEPPSKERKDELLRMHSRLSEMKKMLAVAGTG